MKKDLLAGITLVSLLLLGGVYAPVAFAEETTSPESSPQPHHRDTKALNTTHNNTDTADNGVTIGNSGDASTPAKEDKSSSTDTTPAIREAIVLGDLNKDAHGLDYFKDITISLIGDNLTDDHFLSPEGLHWSDKTRVELIQGEELGDYDYTTFPSDIPHASMKAYRINDGDSGRITYVGKTKSGIDLDLIWTVIGSDKEEWAENSGFADHRVRGLGFIGEQFFPGATGNSITVTYNNASNLGLQYKIVRHGTTIEQPVIVSFISTDIDSAQGVETDLANIVEIIPEDSHLTKQDGIIYDTTKGVLNLTGSKDLPRGGYLGTSFASTFNYVFYAPAPARVHNSYLYPQVVRYDIFGSSLQAKLLTKVQQHILIRYVDTKGHELKPEEYYQGFTDKSYRFNSLEINKHKLVAINKDMNNINHPIVTFVYAPSHTITFHFIDENGNTLAADKQYTLVDGKELFYVPNVIEGYHLPKRFDGKITADTEHSFVYKKISSPAHQAAPNAAANRMHNNHQDLSGISHLTKAEKADLGKPSVTGRFYAAPLITEYEGFDDPFLINTGMNADEKKVFLEFLKKTREDACQKPNYDRHQVNREIATMLAYPAYHDNKLENLVIDFEDARNAPADKNITKLLQNIHGKSQYIVDIPHFAATLASAEDQGFIKEAIKFVAGFSPLVLPGHTPFDNFFQLNSLTGDYLTIISKKDRNTDVDAFIVHHHPDYKDMFLDEALIKYYSMNNLDMERERLYQEALNSQSGLQISAHRQERLNIFLATLTLGGIALIALNIWERRQKEEASRKQNYQFAVGSLHSLGTQLYSFTTKGMLGTINLIAPRAAALGSAIRTVLNKRTPSLLVNKLIKPALSHIAPKALAPIMKGIIKPAVTFARKQIDRLNPARHMAPAIKHVKKVITASVGAIKNRNVVKSIQQAMTSPVYKRVIKPIYNKRIAPTIQAIHHRVVRPNTQSIRRIASVSVTSFVKTKIVAPITNLFKKLWN